MSVDYPRAYGSYMLLEPIGRGGMSEVELARRTVGDSAFVRFLVIKRIHQRHAADASFVTMFMDEARISAELAHENIAQVYDFGQVEDEYFMAMEYVPGRDLRGVQRLLARRGEKVPLRIALTVIAEVLAGLHYAHSRVDTYGHPMRIVHRDVNPRNIMLSVRGEVKLIDFGVAKSENRLDSTVGHSLKGKFAYMAPEQIEGGVRVDGRADVYAVGLTLHELLEGQSPFFGLGDVQIMHKVLAGGPLTLDIDPGVHPDTRALRQIHARALARDRDDRYPDAATMRADVLEALQPLGGPADRTTMAEFLRVIDPVGTQDIAERLRGYRDHSPGEPPPQTWPLGTPPPGAPEEGSISRSVARKDRTGTMVATTAGVVLGGGAVGLAVLLLAAVAGVFFWRERADQPPAEANAPVATGAAEPPVPTGPAPAETPPESAPTKADGGAANPTSTPTTSPSPPPASASNDPRPAPASPSASPAASTAAEDPPATSTPPEPAVAGPTPGSAEASPTPFDDEPSVGTPVEDVPPAVYGFLNVTSSPDRGFPVTVDGRSVGTTPIRGLKVGVGHHLVEVHNTSTGERTVREVDLKKGKLELVTVGVN